VRASQGVVVVEHSTLELNPLSEEAEALDLLDLLDVTRILGGERRDVIDIPDIAGLLDVLVTVDFGLLVRPIREW